MILYESGGIHYVLKIFQLKGSVFPGSLCVALPCALVAALLRHFTNTGQLTFLEAEDSILKETQAWSGFSFLVGFLIVFRTSQAYNRFWDGCTATHAMRAEWFDAASALVSFCRHSKASDQMIMKFKNTLVRLFSMLHVSALAELEEINDEGKPSEEIKAYGFELIDAVGIDDFSLRTIKASGSKVELIFEWIQLLIVENIETGVLSIPPPILSRAFQEIANGMVAFHDALKITYIPFPFPYAQTCDCLLLLHWVVVPFVTSQWVRWPLWAAIFVFIQVFILWSLNFIAVEIENPFGTDSNDLAGEDMQKEMNRHLMMLLQPETIRTPQLATKRASWCPDPLGKIWVDSNASFLEVWDALDDQEVEVDEASAFKAFKGTQHGSAPIASSGRKGQEFFDAWLPRHSALNREGKMNFRSSMDSGRGSARQSENPSDAGTRPRASWNTTPNTNGSSVGRRSTSRSSETSFAAPVQTKEHMEQIKESRSMENMEQAELDEPLQPPSTSAAESEIINVTGTWEAVQQDGPRVDPAPDKADGRQDRVDGASRPAGKIPPAHRGDASLEDCHSERHQPPLSQPLHEPPEQTEEHTDTFSQDCNKNIDGVAGATAMQPSCSPPENSENSKS